MFVGFDHSHAVEDAEWGTIRDQVLFQESGVEHIFLCAELHVQPQVSNTASVLHGSRVAPKTIHILWICAYYFHAISIILHDAAFFNAEFV
mmetsp:Transcript_884/g.1333  ORF Transcript_884/g.1333 Transcript_884/m.1333 type:complete len:91 (+) Transcript_884:2178-2450(+)